VTVTRFLWAEKRDERAPQSQVILKSILSPTFTSNLHLKMTSYSRDERMKRLLEESKDDSSASSRNASAMHCPFDIPSTYQDGKDESFASNQSEGDSSLYLDNFQTMNFDNLDVLDTPITSLQSKSNLRNLLSRPATAHLQDTSRTKHCFTRKVDSAGPPERPQTAVCKTNASSYEASMPSLEELMQPWPKGMEDALKEGSSIYLPPPEVDLSLEEYAKQLCSIFDIPVAEGSLVNSVHVLLRLFVEYKEQRFLSEAI
jgi:hypothetical protein